MCNFYVHKTSMHFNQTHWWVSKFSVITSEYELQVCYENICIRQGTHELPVIRESKKVARYCPISSFERCWYRGGLTALLIVSPQASVILVTKKLYICILTVVRHSMNLLPLSSAQCINNSNWHVWHYWQLKMDSNHRSKHFTCIFINRATVWEIIEDKLRKWQWFQHERRPYAYCTTFKEVYPDRSAARFPIIQTSYQTCHFAWEMICSGKLSIVT